MRNIFKSLRGKEKAKKVSMKYEKIEGNLKMRVKLGRFIPACVCVFEFVEKKIKKNLKDTYLFTIQPTPYFVLCLTCI